MLKVPFFSASTPSSDKPLLAEEQSAGTVGTVPLSSYQRVPSLKE